MSCGAAPHDHHPIRVRRRRISASLATRRQLPFFPVEITPPDLTPWRSGNCGIEGVVSLKASVPGPNVVVTSLIHGNEFAGASALDRMLRQGVQPRSGTLTFIFANLDAFDRFDPNNPVASRFVDEDLNRVWSQGYLDTPQSGREWKRAHALLPVIEQADILLDLHSMLWEADPLLISPPTQRSRAISMMLAGQTGSPRLSLTDLGHTGGARLIEHPRFISAGSPARSVLLEAGQHWRHDTVRVSEQTARWLIDHAEQVYRDGWRASPYLSEHAAVTDNVIARSADFTFRRSYRGGEVIARGGTVIAQDGDDEICTPYDRCLLVMPNLQPRRGQLAVRLARFLKDAHAPG